jgi:Tfp pilus assembly protein PilF
MVAGFAGLSAAVAGLALQGRSLRMGVVALAPLLFVLVPLLQSLPLPPSLRGWLDPNGTSLLAENSPLPAPAASNTGSSSRPLSLDPPNTRVDVGHAALALIAFLVAYHLASGQSNRYLILRAVALAGIAAVILGLGHRIFGITKLYGMFTSSRRSLLVGPFVNANHTAEFLELASCTCLACAFLKPSLLNRLGWLTGMALCAAGAVATLSRGAVLAMAMAGLMFVFLLYVMERGATVGRRRVSLAWVLLILGSMVVIGAALGANQLIDRFKADAVTTDIRLRLWRDAWRVVVAHPFGIGRGAFDRVFPIYKTLQTPFPLRFAFVECEPFQLLIDCGWTFFVLLLAGLGLLLWWIVRFGRRDRVEAALLTGLFALAVHSTVDFAFETIGVLLPFAAIAGVVAGRAPSAADAWRNAGKARWAIVGVATFGLAFGIASAAHASYDDFDALLKRPLALADRQALVARAERAHPVDYFYTLEDARLAPLQGKHGGPSPRLHLLNRALRLCPSCESVHLEVARNMWRVGLRQQALLEARTAVDLQPSLFGPVLRELWAAGAKPEQLSAVAAPSAPRMLKLVDFLAERGRIAEASVVLDRADALGVPRAESLILRATLQLRAGDTDAAAQTVEATRTSGVLDPRLALLQAELIIKRQGATGADEALAVLDTAAVRTPLDTGIQFKRVQVVMQFKKWKAADRAIEGLKMALYQSGGALTEAHVAAARLQADMGRLTAALTEYRIALGERPNDVGLWMEYGHAAEAAGRISTASEAYSEAARLSPNRPDVVNAQRGLDERRNELRALSEGK